MTAKADLVDYIDRGLAEERERFPEVQGPVCLTEEVWTIISKRLRAAEAVCDAAKTLLGLVGHGAKCSATPRVGDVVGVLCDCGYLATSNRIEAWRAAKGPA